MSNYLKPDSISDLHGISVQGLAHVGDAVYELMVRTWLCTQGSRAVKRLHDEAVLYVSAKAQAAKTEIIIPELDEEEFMIYKRGRNSHLNNVPRGSTIEEYHIATGLETLFGYLYLSGRTGRLNELFEYIIGEKIEGRHAT